MNDSDIVGLSFVLICAAITVWILQAGGKPAQPAPSSQPPTEPEDEAHVSQEISRSFMVRKKGITEMQIQSMAAIRERLNCRSLSPQDEVKEIGAEDWLPIKHTDIQSAPREPNHTKMPSKDGQVLMAQAKALHQAGGWMYLVNPIAAFGMRRAAKTLRDTAEKI
jgi:hypothetical protein